MMFNPTSYVVLSALVTNVMCRDGLHLATRGFLQIPPSFSGKGIVLYPAHHPDHDATDLEHLIPKINNELYYAQEGHRPAVHGAKHGSLQANFTRPTIVLDHTSHLTSIECGDSGSNTNICFTPEGFEQARKTWTIQEMNLMTFHIGCGDETSGQRSYFLAKEPQFDTQSGCVTLETTRIAQEDALDSGEITWGTYKHPRKRAPVKGHVRVSKPNNVFRDRPAPPPSPQRRSNNRPAVAPVFMRRQTTNDTNSTTDYPFPPGDGGPLDEGDPVDLTVNGTAIWDFFTEDDIDISSVHTLVTPEENPDFIYLDGETGTEEEEGLNYTRRQLLQRHRLHQRSWGSFFQGVWNGVKQLAQAVKNFVTNAVDTIAKVGKTVVAIAITAAKIIAVPFGVPFNESYHNDFKFNYTATGTSATNRPPPIFGYNDGFNLAGTGAGWRVQCAKCGVQADFTVEGRLAFSVQNGVTAGFVALSNHDTFNIDAIFGISIELQFDQTVKLLDQPIATVPLSPLAIPGIITLGPMLAVDAALDLVLNGQADILIGGSLSIAPGKAQLSIVNQADNIFQGFTTTFTPIAKASGVVTASIELGLPISLEVGLDVLNGKFKKTVGLVNKPSVYASAAAVSLTSPLPCSGGVDIRLGVKNRIYIQAVGLWDYDVRTDILYEQNIACVGIAGFSQNAVLPEAAVFTDVPLVTGADIANIQPNITDYAQNLTSPAHNNVGFRVVMDQDKSSILVSGSDGFIYLVSSDDQYDVSAPWGSVDLTTDTISLDVFGRVMAWIGDRYKRTVGEVRVWDPSKVPRNYFAAALTVLKTPAQNFQAYTVALSYRSYATGKSTTLAPYYPTFCKTPQGLRLYATLFLIDQNGDVNGTFDDAYWIAQGFRFFNQSIDYQSNCRTVMLTSFLTS